MKRLLALIIILTIFVIVLSSCNMSCGPGNYTFNHLHYITYNNEGCLDVLNWHESSSGAGIEVKTHDGTSYFFSEGTYILIENKNFCPFC